MKKYIPPTNCTKNFYTVTYLTRMGRTRKVHVLAENANDAYRKTKDEYCYEIDRVTNIVFGQWNLNLNQESFEYAFDSCD